MGHCWAFSCSCGDRTRESFLHRPCRGVESWAKYKAGRSRRCMAPRVSLKKRGNCSEGPEERSTAECLKEWIAWTMKKAWAITHYGFISPHRRNRRELRAQTPHSTTSSSP
ncbi:hypothetical protein B296_00050118 [Ensete ventricosum]|uniref:Uncharacterized protein n=1 Tax=Ensete ventricosum TaxID=4639 RepID=A0A426YMQ3_ENSVE|nr:hypothetical protein B296_00050118 [Ensete ventricosum]